MYRVMKEAILLLFINSLYVHCRNVLTNQNENRMSFLSLKGNEMFDVCVPNPCKNGGECLIDASEERGFRCECYADWKGKTCEETVCPCKNGGECHIDGSKEGGFRCECTGEWIGETCEEKCDCGFYGVCSVEDGRKECSCAGLTAELDGQCVECDCGANAWTCTFRIDGAKTCYCNFGFINVNGKCSECNCGSNGVCTFEFGKKKCVCGPGFIESDGICVANEVSSTVDSSLMSTILTTTATYCDCGLGGSCHLDSFGEKICKCFTGYAPHEGHCYDCNCGKYSMSCRFNWKGDKICVCFPGYVENYGRCDVMEFTTLEGSTTIRTTALPSTTQYCNCGTYSISCRFNWRGEKICDCFPGYVENYGTCKECNCGPYGTCSFKDGRKRCHCSPFAVEMNGVCVDKAASSEGTTDSITSTSYIGSSTVQECDCGPLGRCTFEYGRKKCICDSHTAEKNGKCVECNCGENTKSCRFDWKGDKTCNCSSGSALMYGICKECNCGANARNCFYGENGAKVCNCDFGYIETNGYCSSICNEDKCIHGNCEIVGNAFECRCIKGFTGRRCEEKVQTKSNKENLWMVLLLSVMFALFILLSCMFCFWTRILNRISKK